MDIALIGCGVWGRNILRELVALGANVRVYDSDAEMLLIAQDHGASEVHPCLDQFEGVDGIVIATPASNHVAMIRELDDRGICVPIFCEKPLAVSGEDAPFFLNRESAPIHVMHIWRYHPGIIKLKELLTEGVIGELTQLRSVRANWTSPRSDVDCLANLAPHDLSIFQYLLDHLPAFVSAAAEQINDEVVSCIATLRGDSGINCILEVSNRYEAKRREVRVHGTEGVMVLPDDSSGVIRLVREGGFIVPDAVQEIEYKKQSALNNQLQTWLDFLGQGDDTNLCDVRQGVEIAFVIDKIRTAIK